MASRVCNRGSPIVSNWPKLAAGLSNGQRTDSPDRSVHSTPDSARPSGNQEKHILGRICGDGRVQVQVQVQVQVHIPVTECDNRV